MNIRKIGFVLLLLLGIAGVSYFFLIMEKLPQEVEVENGSEGNRTALDEAVDKTTEIQKSIDETPAGGTLEIPPGVYKLSKNPDLKAVTGYGEVILH
ncbi:hypothetical protein [Planococcus faecalis]|uniref:hypothetical protein n=1 Tax=Planococcus faecalis TaxID=1598147 RepID=UPI000A9A0577|nr:hypothetical protein [Planococcus faecalis]